RRLGFSKFFWTSTIVPLRLTSRDIPLILNSTTRRVRCLIRPSMTDGEGMTVAIPVPPSLSSAVRSVALSDTASPVYSRTVSQNQTLTRFDARIDFLTFVVLSRDPSVTKGLYHGTGTPVFSSRTSGLSEFL